MVFASDWCCDDNQGKASTSGGCLGVADEEGSPSKVHLVWTLSDSKWDKEGVGNVRRARLKHTGSLGSAQDGVALFMGGEFPFGPQKLQARYGEVGQLSEDGGCCLPARGAGQRVINVVPCTGRVTKTFSVASRRNRAPTPRCLAGHPRVGHPDEKETPQNE